MNVDDILAAVPAGRTHAAGNVAAAGQPLRQPSAVRGGRRELELRTGAARRGALRRHARRGGNPPRRPRGADVRQPRRIHGELSRLRLARRRCGADQRRVARAAARAFSAKFRRAAADHRGGVARCTRPYRLERAGARAHLADRRRNAGVSRSHWRAHCPDRHPAARRSDRSGRSRSRPDAGHPLHVGHDRSVEGRLLPACAIFLVGPQRHPQSGASRGRRALHHVAAVPHQRARHIPPGLIVRFDAGRRAALFRVALLAKADRTPGNGDLSARRDGADPALQRAVARRAKSYGALCARARRAGQSACSVSSTLGHPFARRLRLDRDEFRHRQHRRRAAPRKHGHRARRILRARHRPIWQRSPTGRTRRACRARGRETRFRHRLFRHAAKRPPRLFATAGFTPAIAWCARRTDTFASSIG